jgi:hypothetical protein
MGNRSKADILSSVSRNVADASNKVREKRRKRRTLPDMCNLFETNWAAGQRETTPGMPVAKILSRDRALLKTRIIKPFDQSGTDIEGFARWVSQHWQAIGAQFFPKSKGYPERPAFRWLIVCLDTYIDAWAQKDYLDPEGKISTSHLHKKAANADAMVADAMLYGKATKEELTDMAAQLAEARKEIAELRKGGIVKEADPIYEEIRQGAMKPTVFGNYEEGEAEEQRKHRKRLKARVAKVKPSREVDINPFTGLPYE